MTAAWQGFGTDMTKTLRSSESSATMTTMTHVEEIGTVS